MIMFCNRGAKVYTDQGIGMVTFRGTTGERFIEKDIVTVALTKHSLGEAIKAMVELYKELDEAPVEWHQEAASMASA